MEKRKEGRVEGGRKKGCEEKERQACRHSPLPEVPSSDRVGPLVR